MRATSSRLKALVAAAAVSAATLVWAAPALAQTPTPNTSCTSGSHTFNGLGYYQNEGSRHRWVRWQYILGHTGPSSNVNIRLLENTTIVYSNNSPDNRHQDQLYTHTPPLPVSTLAGSVDRTRFEAIFDESLSDDPRCFAYTADI